MCPKPRKPENKGLPERWRFKHNAYYYRVPPGQEHQWNNKKEFRLGKTLPEAYREWSSRLDLQKTARTVGELLDRYAEQVVPGKAYSTQKNNYRSIKNLKKVFDQVLITELKPSDAYRYLDVRSNHGKTKTTANRDYEVLSHAFTKAIEWGLCDDHPVKGKVNKYKTSPCERHVEDWEVREVLKVADHFMSLYIKIKIITGLRKGDLLSIKLDDLREDGIHVVPNKTSNTTGKKIIFTWNEQLRAVVDEIKKLPKYRRTQYLFETRGGKPFVNKERATNSFDSRWQRFIKKALEETSLTERFREHDLRAKPGSDTYSLEHATLLLGHSSQEITKRVYRRKPEIVTSMYYEFLDEE